MENTRVQVKDWYLMLGGGIHSLIDARRIILLCSPLRTGHGDGHRASSLVEGVAVVAPRGQQINFGAIYRGWAPVDWPVVDMKGLPVLNFEGGSIL